MSVAAELTAGGVAGAAGLLATQPMDTIRVRLQSPASQLGHAVRYSGIVDCWRVTMREEGARGLYKGVASPTVTCGAMNALLFFSYEYSSRALLRWSGQPATQEMTLLQVFAAGSASGFCSAFINGPTELVKCLAQTNVRNEGRIYEEWLIVRNMVAQHGLLGAHGPCRGLLTTVIRDTPSYGLYFVVYEAIARALGKGQAAGFLAGGCAGAAAWAVIYPLDVLKTRWQIAPPGMYRSLRHCLQATVAADGWGALGRGFGATMARAWPQHGVVFCTYDLLKGWLAPKC